MSFIDISFNDLIYAIWATLKNATTGFAFGCLATLFATHMINPPPSRPPAGDPPPAFDVADLPPVVTPAIVKQATAMAESGEYLLPPNARKFLFGITGPKTITYEFYGDRDGGCWLPEGQGTEQAMRQWVAEHFPSKESVK